jgi:hypothetical protein
MLHGFIETETAAGAAVGITYSLDSGRLMGVSFSNAKGKTCPHFVRFLESGDSIQMIIRTKLWSATLPDDCCQLFA